MSVHIKEINVRHLGPIPQFSIKPGLINLIFGHNEKGKTYLVEFLIRSLFKNIRQWSLRSETGQGKVSVQGLEDGDVIFSPKSARKLDDFWNDAKLGLPPDFSRLLMVKGAEVALNEKGADKNIIAHYLSGQDILSQIEKQIPSNILKAEIHSDDITGPSQGQIKNRTDLKKLLENLDRLFEEINQDYSGGQRRILMDQKEILKKELAELEKARKYRAFQLSHELERLNKEIHRIDEEKLNQLDKDVHLYKLKKQEIKRKGDIQQKADAQSKHYTWLQKAEKSYDTFLQESRGHSSYLFLLLTIIMVMVFGVFLFFKITSGMWVAFTGALLCGGFSVWQVRRTIRNTNKGSELQNIKMSYQERFGEPLSDHLRIKERLQSMEEDFNNARLLKKQLEEDIADIDSRKVSIESRMTGIANSKLNSQLWEEMIRDEKNRLSDLNSNREKNKIELEKLMVDPSDYISEKPDIEYSSQRENDLNIQSKKVETDIKQIDEKLDTLKRSIYAQIGDVTNDSWENLIYHLQQKQSEVEKEYKQVTAEIIGKKVVYEVIQNLRKDEDQKIGESLQSESIIGLLEKITGKYNNFILKENRLIVSSAHDDFDLSDLSTGTQEQVLLALRIGFASKLLGKQGEPLFLILDDAFQYSDWERRERLVGTVIDLAKTGWQIIYFTMDDHIKSLFQKRGKVFGNDFQYFNLSDIN